MGAAQPKIKIGLEIHGYLDVPSKTKLFCTCSLEPSDPNTQICPVCTGQPGSKPMLPNREAVDAILRIALFLECTINPELLFQRKHYSWPDLPNGFQKTMSGAYSQPVGLNGKFLGVGIEEIHLEEDPARWDPISGGVDYNRSGYPLVEIVTKPEFTSAEHVREWIESLMVALSYIHAVRRDLGVKCDVNVSIEPSFIRTEVKNVNSFSAIVAAIKHEYERQQKETTMQQTRAWDEASGTTKFMRSKETALDYMFIPDPDLPLIVVTDEWKNKISSLLPKRPDQMEAKFIDDGVPKDVAKRLSANLIFANGADKLYTTADNKIPLSFVADRFVNEIPANTPESLLQNAGTAVSLASALAPSTIAFYERRITNFQYKEMAEKIIKNLAAKGDPEAIAKDSMRAIAEVAKTHISNSDSLLSHIKDAIAANPKAVADVKAGNEKAINAIAGHVIKALKADGKSADPAVIQKLIKEQL